MDHRKCFESAHAYGYCTKESSSQCMWVDEETNPWNLLPLPLLKYFVCLCFFFCQPQFTLSVEMLTGVQCCDQQMKYHFNEFTLKQQDKMSDWELNVPPEKRWVKKFNEMFGCITLLILASSHYKIPKLICVIEMCRFVLQLEATWRIKLRYFIIIILFLIYSSRIHSCLLLICGDFFLWSS